jgi:hypothetical protein
LTMGQVECPTVHTVMVTYYGKAKTTSACPRDAP